METASPSIGVIRAQIHAIRDKTPSARVFGIYTQTRWSGPSSEGNGEDRVAVYQCDSPLQMRLALQDAMAESGMAVLITPLDQSNISDDILVRLAQRRLHPINSWEIVRQLFRARQLDPRISCYTFLADLLLEHASEHPFPPAVGGLVDAETVWSILFEGRLGLIGPYPDIVEILRAATESDLARRWQVSSLMFRQAAAQWICQYAGDSSQAVLNCIATEYGDKALAIGLVMGVVFDEAVGHELERAAGRLESFAGADTLPTENARRWSTAASECLSRLPLRVQRQCQEDAETIMKSVGAQSAAWRSPELQSGLEQRLIRLAKGFESHINDGAKTISSELQEAFDAVMSHRRICPDTRRILRVQMALRLSRFLADHELEPVGSATSLEEAAGRYATDGALVDWARQILRGGEANRELATSFGKLVERITELRETENHQFAFLLREQAGLIQRSGVLIPVENILEKVVAKTAERSPVLVLLLDGMSCAVFRELVLDITGQGWIEVAGVGNQQRPLALAALPSVTEVCRTSLFCGLLQHGHASDEVRGFATHPILQKLSAPGLPPKLFHKASLEGTDDSSLAKEVRKAIAERKQRIVGIVVNAVDDYLDKGDQIDVSWNTQQIRVLGPILAEAQDANRVVILLSDHGHICERGTELSTGDDAARWRTALGSVNEKELEITSTRIIGPESGKIIVPWTEKLRYGSKKNGYHGGITPQEMVIPIGLFWGDSQPPDGFEALPADSPQWWTEPTGPGIEREPAPTGIPKDKKPVAPTLFDQIPVRPAAVKRPVWLDQLFASEILMRQKQMAGRVRITDEQSRHFIMSLGTRGGKMTEAALASVMDLPAHRLSGMLAVMQRILNVEGYPVLSRDESSNTISLNIPLLKRQFEITE